jgi:gluconate 2-dehydrogenase alpha chain
VGQGRPRLVNVRERQTTRASGGVIAGADASASALNRRLRSRAVSNRFVAAACASPRNIGYNLTGLVGAPAYFAVDSVKTKRPRNPGPPAPI